jgi:hypothetical protein
MTCSARQQRNKNEVEVDDGEPQEVLLVLLDHCGGE